MTTSDHTTCPLGYGTATGYKLRGCRCRACKDAVAEYQRDYMRRRGYRGGKHLRTATDEEAQQAVNRLTVLNYMGWDLGTISDAAGGTPNRTTLSNILNRAKRPSRDTARHINAAWDVLTSRQDTYQKNSLAGRRPHRAEKKAS